MEWILFAAAVFFCASTAVFGVLWIFSRRGEKPPSLLLETVEMLKEETVRRQEENLRLSRELAKKEASVDELRNQIFKERSRSEILSHQAEELHRQISLFQADEKARDAQTDNRINELNNAVKALRDEQERVLEEERERRRREEENRSRLWNDHERDVQAKLREICKNPAFAFPFYSNANLPDEFVKFKPDALVGFLDQYILFDAKKTGDKNPGNYIRNQVEATAEKILASGSEKCIFRIAVIVVPSSNLAELKTQLYFHSGFTFLIVSPESLEPLAAAFKEIEKYAAAGQYDPSDREQIVGLIARFDTHIRKQNALNLLAAEQGLSVLEEKKRLPKELADEIEVRRAQIRTKAFSVAELQRFMNAPDDGIDSLQLSARRHGAQTPPFGSR